MRFGKVPSRTFLNHLIKSNYFESIFLSLSQQNNTPFHTAYIIISVDGLEMDAAFFRAVESGDLAEVKRGLEQNPGIDVDSLNFHGYTALIWCIRNAHKPIVEVLLAHGAAVNGPVGAPRTPLQEACSLISNARSRSEIVSLLLEHGAAVDAMTAVCRRTSLTLAIWYSETNLGIIQLLLNAGADVNGGGGIIAPLHQAAFIGNTEAIDLLIQSGDVNIL